MSVLDSREVVEGVGIRELVRLSFEPHEREELLDLVRERAYVKLYQRLDEMGVEGDKSALVDALCAYERMQVFDRDDHVFADRLLSAVLKSLDLGQVDESLVVVLKSFVLTQLRRDDRLFARKDSEKQPAVHELVDSVERLMDAWEIDLTRTHIFKLANAVTKTITRMD